MRHKKVFHYSLYLAWLLCAQVLLGWSSQSAQGQVSATEVLATQAVGNEIDGAGVKNIDKEAKQVAAEATADDAGEADEAGEADGEEAAPAQPAAAPAPVPLATLAKSVDFRITLVLKIVLTFVVLLMWISAGDWVSRDSQTHTLGWQNWNMIIFAPFVVVALVMFFLPVATVIRVPVLFVVFVATWIPYVVVHNKNVEPHETVLTGPWWRYVFARMGSKVGIKVDAERKAAWEKGAPVDLIAMGAEDENMNNANLLSARHSPGFLLVKDVIVDMEHRWSDRMMFDFTKQGVKVRYEIDGVWHNGEARDRESSDVMLAVMKTLANLDVKDRRSKQSGEFRAKYEGKSYHCPIVTQGVSTGERVVLSLLGDKKALNNYNDLGMREGLQQQWEELMASDMGLIVLSTLPGGGMTTITDISLSQTDRLMRDFAAVEDINHREEEIQNIKVTTYDTAAGETPDTILPALIRTYPNVFVLRDFVNVESANLMLNEVRDERLVITNVRAKDSAEALLRLLQMKVKPKELASAAKAVLYQRLIRLLCPDCKIAYTPPAEVLKKLGIPAGKIEHLYRPPKPEEIDKPCKTCQGLGYKGRTGVFELLVVTDKMREILIKQPKIDLLKKASRSARQRSLQEEGILLVAKGITSVQELMRILKQ